MPQKLFVKQSGARRPQRYMGEEAILARRAAAGAATGAAMFDPSAGHHLRRALNASSWRAALATCVLAAGSGAQCLDNMRGFGGGVGCVPPPKRPLSATLDVLSNFSMRPRGDGPCAPDAPSDALWVRHSIGRSGSAAMTRQTGAHPTPAERRAHPPANGVRCRPPRVRVACRMRAAPVAPRTSSLAQNLQSAHGHELHDYRARTAAAAAAAASRDC